MMVSLFQSFLPSRQPLMTRPGYRRELVTSATFPVAVATIEGGVVGVLADKAFGVSAFVFATIMAAPMFANLTSFLWSRLARGRRKVRCVAGMMIGLLLCVASIAMLPAPTPEALAAGEPTRLWVEAALVGLIVLGRCMLAGITTLRSAVWRNNYSRRYRGRVTGKFIVLASILMAGSPLISGRLMDHDPSLFQWVYPASAAIGLIGALSFSRIRLRRERELMRYERSLGSLAAAPALPPDSPDVPTVVPATVTTDNFITVLRRDRNFRDYMFYQFIAGIANMVCDVAMISFVIAMTPRDNFFAPILLNVTAPMLMVTLSLPLWGRYLDRVHITRYRMRHSVVWLIEMSCYFLIGMAIVEGGASYWWLLLPRLLHGVGQGGGMIAWQLGHNDFADRRLVALYMGIHVTLTGVRGAIAPYLAIALFWGWSAGPLLGRFGGPGIPAFTGIGVYLFLITLAMCGVAMIGYYRMNGRIQREADAMVED